MENEIYQELYAIRSSLQSMDLRSELVAIRQLLERMNAQLTALTKAAGGAPVEMEDVKQKPKGMFGFLR